MTRQPQDPEADARRRREVIAAQSNQRIRTMSRNAGIDVLPFSLWQELDDRDEEMLRLGSLLTEERQQVPTRPDELAERLEPEDEPTEPQRLLNRR